MTLRRGLWVSMKVYMIGQKIGNFGNSFDLTSMNKTFDK